MVSRTRYPCCALKTATEVFDPRTSLRVEYLGASREGGRSTGQVWSHCQRKATIFTLVEMVVPTLFTVKLLGPTLSEDTVLLYLDRYILHTGLPPITWSVRLWQKLPSGKLEAAYRAFEEVIVRIPWASMMSSTTCSTWLTRAMTSGPTSSRTPCVGRIQAFANTDKMLSRTP
jgi:hypothetical protein